MGIKSKIKSWFFLDEEYEEEYEEVPRETVNEKQQKPQPHKQNVVRLESVKSSSKLILMEPKFFAEAQEIADHIKGRRPVVVNLQRIDPSEARRIIDFLGGTVYALGGEIQKIGSHIILCTPENVEVSGTISETFLEGDFDDTRW